MMNLYFYSSKWNYNILFYVSSKTTILETKLVCKRLHKRDVITDTLKCQMNQISSYPDGQKQILKMTAASKSFSGTYINKVFTLFFIIFFPFLRLVNNCLNKSTNILYLLLNKQIVFYKYIDIHI